MKLLTEGSSNRKISKNSYRTKVLNLTANYRYKKDNYTYSTCSHASKECSRLCLDESGFGRVHSVQDVRLSKTLWFFQKEEEFIEKLSHELYLFNRLKIDEPKACRLNCTSDIDWENYLDLEEYPEIQFYDYSKNPIRMMEFISGNFPSNYHLTFSRSETKANNISCKKVLSAGGNVAVVFRNIFPKTYKINPDSDSYKVVDGVSSDERFLDPHNVIVGLKPIGKACQKANANSLFMV